MTRLVWRWALGVGALAALGWVARRGRGAGGAVALSPPPVEAGPRRRAWVELVGAPLALRPGVFYRACVALPWMVSERMISDAAVARYAAGLGFGAVRVVERGGDPCELVVEARWERGYQAADRPGALLRVWELRDVD